MGSGESPFFPAEEFAFDEARRQGRAVHRDKRAIPAAAHLMDGIGYHPLAGSGFTEDEHGGIRRGHLPAGQQHLFKCVAVPDDLLKPMFFLKFFAKVQILAFKLLSERFNLGQAFLEITFQALLFADIDRYAEQPVHLAARPAISSSSGTNPSQPGADPDTELDIDRFLQKSGLVDHLAKTGKVVRMDGAFEHCHADHFIRTEAENRPGLFGCPKCQRTAVIFPDAGTGGMQGKAQSHLAFPQKLIVLLSSQGIAENLGDKFKSLHALGALAAFLILV